MVTQKEGNIMTDIQNALLAPAFGGLATSKTPVADSTSKLKINLAAAVAIVPVFVGFATLVAAVKADSKQLESTGTSKTAQIAKALFQMIGGGIILFAINSLISVVEALKPQKGDDQSDRLNDREDSNVDSSELNGTPDVKGQNEGQLAGGQSQSEKPSSRDEHVEPPAKLEGGQTKSVIPPPANNDQ